MSGLENFYHKRYKLLLLIPLALFLLSIFIIWQFNEQNGDYFEKDVSLRGGVSATIYLDKEFNIENIESFLTEKLGREVFIRSLATTEGNTHGFLVEAVDIDADHLQALLEEFLAVDLNDENFFVEETGSRLGEDFYAQMIRAVFIAFVLMCITVFIIFRKVVPSLAVILSALLDLIVTIALIDLLHIRISAAGIAAVLLLVGYSIDTDMLLTTRMIKRKEGTIWQRIVSSAKTGLTMTAAGLVTTLIGYFLATNLVLQQMFLIISLGLIIDVIATYIMNASLLTWYLEKKEHV